MLEITKEYLLKKQLKRERRVKYLLKKQLEREQKIRKLLTTNLKKYIWELEPSCDNCMWEEDDYVEGWDFHMCESESCTNWIHKK